MRRCGRLRSPTLIATDGYSIVSFTEYVAAHRDEVYEKLFEYLPTAGPPQYDEMVSSYVRRKGKYVRPALVLLWAELCGTNASDAVLPAAALQLTEDFSEKR